MSGLQNHSAGRAGDPPAISLSARLKELKLPQGRLKTGTPPRIDGRSIDFSKLMEQPGDLDPVPVFSFLGSAAQHPRQVPCWITHTNERTHEIIRSGLRPQPDVHRRDRRRRAALLPEHRRQGQPLCRQVEPPDLSGARRPDARTRSTRTAFRPRLPFDVQLAAVRSMAGLGERAHPAAGLCDRVRLLRPARADAQLRDAGDRRVCSSPARSTARPGMKRRPRRACLPASMPRCKCRASAHGCPDATKPTWACWSTTWSPRASPSRTGCSPAAPSTGCNCARTTPTCA